MNERYVIQLGLTRREAELLMSCIKRGILRSKQSMRRDPDFVPAPGKLDANKARIEALTRVHERIKGRHSVLPYRATDEEDDDRGNR